MFFKKLIQKFLGSQDRTPLYVDKVKVTALEKTRVSAAEDAEDVRKDWRRETGGASAKFQHHQSAVLQLLQELEVPFLQPSAFQGVQLNINYCVTLRM